MSKDELDELEKSPNYIHLTEDDIRKAGELAFKNVKKEVKKEKRNVHNISIINNNSHSECEMINPPFNYTGSKFKLLDQILPLLDYNKEYFIDLFCGGGSVYTNVLDK